MNNILYFSSKLFQTQNHKLSKTANHAKPLLRHYTIRRSMMVVPAYERRKVDSSLSLRADCLNFRLFPQSSQDLKEHGREIISSILNDKKIGDNETEWCITVHPVQYENDFLQDINAVLDAVKLPSAISLPHVNNCQQLKWFVQEIWKKILKRHRGDRTSMKVLLEITSPKGIMKLPELCEYFKDLTKKTTIELSGLIFGYETLKKYLGTTRTPGGLECIYSRQKLVLIAKAFGLQAIDFPHCNPIVGNELRNECEDAVVLGFTGKLVLYPAQIGLVQSMFNPSRTRVKDAQNIAQNFVLSNQHQNLNDENESSNDLLMDADELRVANYVMKVAKDAVKYTTETEYGDYVKR